MNNTSIISATISTRPAAVIPMGNGLELPQVTYKGQAVLTSKAIAAVLGSDRRDISRNFERKRSMYEEGVDYFLLTSKEAKALGFPHPSQKLGRQIVALDFFRYSGTGMVLFTRRGLAKLSKSVGTPQAWAMMDTFVDAYFTLEGLANGTLSNLEAAAKAREVVSTGSMLLDGMLLGRATPEELAKAYGKGLDKDTPKVSELTQMVDTLNRLKMQAKDFQAMVTSVQIKMRPMLGTARNDETLLIGNRELRRELHITQAENKALREELATLKAAVAPLQNLLKNQ